MTKSIGFTLRFPHFEEESQKRSFSTGIHVIYGEAGVGKSAFARILAGHTVNEPVNFVLEDYQPPEHCFFIPQNPENQFVTSTVADELAFSLECQPGDPKILRQQYAALDRLIPDSINRQIHPVNLSGGEKELLNLVLAQVEPQDVVVIDDGFSFLNDDVKPDWVHRMDDWSRTTGAVIFWFTSEWDDLKWGQTKWELSLSGLHPVSDIAKHSYPKNAAVTGTMSITIDQLSFGYQPDHPILDNLSFRGKQIAHLGITGPNGSGKTTLALLMMNILSPERGSVSLSLDSYCKPCYMDQFPERMLGVGTVEEWIQELLSANLLSVANLELIKSVLEQFQIPWSTAKKKMALDLSWSTLRTMIIVVLSYADFDPIILDEPTFGLGWRQRVILQRFLLRKMHTKHTIIISHDRKFIQAMCDHILTLKTPTGMNEPDKKDYVEARKSKNN